MMMTISYSSGLVAAFSLLLLGNKANGFELKPQKSTFSSRRFQPSSSSSSSSLAANNDNEKYNDNDNMLHSRRSMMTTSAVTTAAAIFSLTPTSASAAAKNNGLILTTAPTSRLRWADAKIGSGDSPKSGGIVSIDYSMASTAGRFPQIYTTKNGDTPYRWKLGDGSTIQGIEMAVMGNKEEGISPMQPGGIRRVIVPNTLGYNDLISSSSNSNLSPAGKNKRCIADNEGSIGPIPPKDAPDGAYQRWYQFYCNPRIPYQPDLVLDIKLYGKRTATTTATTRD